MKRYLLLFVLFVFSSAHAATTVVLQNAQGTVLHDTGISINGANWSGDWYLPGSQVKGLVYLQHGFTRGGGNYRDLGVALMGQGMMVLSVNAPMSGGNESLAQEVATALANNPPVPPNGYAFPQQLVLSGHSAGGLHVSLVAERMIQQGQGHRISGLVLLDPVNAFGPFGRTMGVVGATAIPVLAVTANGSLCNTFNDTQGTLRSLPRDYVGIKLTNRSTHIDSEGDNTDVAAILACGYPKDYNISTLRDFTVAWANDMLTGSHTAAFYPGGSRVNQLLNQERARLIKDASGAWATVLEQHIGDSFYGERRFTVIVPDVGVGQVEISTRGSGRADLYVRRDAEPSRWRHDCRDTGWDANQTCVLHGPGTYHILVRSGMWGYSATLKARYFEY